MAGYAEVLLAVGPAAVMGVAMLWNSHIQSSSSTKRLERELSDAREKDVKQRRREVKGEPLLAFRRELATMAQKQRALVVLAQMQHTNMSITEEAARGFYKDASDGWNSYLISGDYERALFQLDDQDIVDKAAQLSMKFSYAYVKTTDEDRKPVFKELEEISGEIRELQELINEKLIQL